MLKLRFSKEKVNEKDVNSVFEMCSPWLSVFRRSSQEEKKRGERKKMGRAIVEIFTSGLSKIKYFIF